MCQRILLIIRIKFGIYTKVRDNINTSVQNCILAVIICLTVQAVMKNTIRSH